MNQLWRWPWDPSTSPLSAQDEERRSGGEDRNRTYPATCMATTVLKTARATRHPSLSEFLKTPYSQCSTSKTEFLARKARFGVFRWVGATGRIRRGELESAFEK
jgi:hypothetical protein